MSDDPVGGRERLTTTEAAFLLGWWLAHGEAISNRDASRLTGLPCNTARRMMERGCRVVPITFDHGVWYAIALDETRES